MQDYGVPYGFAPCLLTHPQTLKDQPDLVRDFLAATSEGFQFAAENVDKSADILIAGAKEENGFKIEPALARASQAVLSPQYLTATGTWGAMDPKRWSEYLSWLSVQGLLTTYKQSREPKSVESVSLDDLRAGNSGDPIDPETL